MQTYAHTHPRPNRRVVVEDWERWPDEETALTPRELEEADETPWLWSRDTWLVVWIVVGLLSWIGIAWLTAPMWRW